ncbi:unnamed protein product, partial [Ectocarpus sp. 6 AP-2014]
LNVSRSHVRVLHQPAQGVPTRGVGVRYCRRRRSKKRQTSPSKQLHLLQVQGNVLLQGLRWAWSPSGLSGGGERGHGRYRGGVAAPAPAAREGP